VRALSMTGRGIMRRTHLRTALAAVAAAAVAVTLWSASASAETAEDERTFGPGPLCCTS
jgi:hypothetical protein